MVTLCDIVTALGGSSFIDPSFLQLLYDSLPESIQKRLLPGKEVEDISTTDHGVTVRCSDGTVEEGSIVIGADGVHSTVRRRMRELMAGDGAADAAVAEKPLSPRIDACSATPRTRSPELQPARSGTCTALGRLRSSLLEKRRLGFLLYQKLDKPTRDRRRYTKEDQDRFVAEIGDAYVTPTLRLRDVYEAKEWSVLSVLHEGVIGRFYWQRIVLIGDAVNKQTPNMGFGWNCGGAGRGCSCQPPTSASSGKS